ncbi:GatB/YqeY domain-containing protein [Spiribacter sp. C176]|uniref:GatB/YqeY domain-containing protein n=1 Tax=Spiribacter salilacus TaxID=2664894 RepID=A0A6N7QRR6_9GAMM|nr:GatB/YqeY domain-containing protein [Spiribacter salilacus]MRH78280.1 GatB/YqeY domain-containing protein [Spiribacter salilacus]
MSDLKAAINESVKAAMRAGEKTRLGTLRLITAAIKQKEVDDRRELTDADVLAILDKMVKQRRESESQYSQANREDLAVVERAEMAIIAEFLPQPLSDKEIDTLVQEAITTTGAQSVKDMGKVMGILKPQVQGRADMSQVSARVKAQLN